MKKNNKTPKLTHLSIKVEPWIKQCLDRIAKNTNSSLTTVVKAIMKNAFIASDNDFVARGGKITQ